MSAELLAKLYTPFAPDEHEVRELRRTRNGKIQWLVYIRREAITLRLDTCLPLEWEFKTNEPRREDGYVSVKGSLIIKGLARDNNGAASNKSLDDERKPLPPDEDTEKAAMTDCFKRCASSWGIGLYLQKAPDIYTAGYEKGKWEEMRQREQEAMAKAWAWVSSLMQANDQPRAPITNVDTTTGEVDEFANLRAQLEEAGFKDVKEIRRENGHIVVVTLTNYGPTAHQMLARVRLAPVRVGMCNFDLPG